jgi:hypothetical protein
MTTIAIELNDAALVAYGSNGMLGIDAGREPGYAAVNDGLPCFGSAAFCQARLRPRNTWNRFWREISSAPLPAAVGPCATSADLVHAHLQSLWNGWSDGVTGVIFVVPGYWSQEQLGLLLGIAEELAIPVIGMVDATVAATRCHYEADDLLDIDVSLHDLTVTRVRQDGGVSLDIRKSIDGIGIERLERVCVEHIATCFLRQTRFDPLHDANSEQALYDRLGEWLRLLQRSDSVTATLERGGEEYQVRVKRDDLVAALTTFIEPLMQQVRSRLTAGQTVAVQVSDRLAGFPGIIDAFARIPQVMTFVLEPAAAARGALSRSGQFVKGNGGVTFKTTLQWDLAAAEMTLTGNSVSSEQSQDDPTHILHRGRVYRIGHKPLQIGSELVQGEYGIRLSADHEGVSRRHCSVLSGANGMELVDHSRFGTRLNGHVIDKSAVLRTGDTIGVGKPSVDLRIVTECTARDSSDGA